MIKQVRSTGTWRMSRRDFLKVSGVAGLSLGAGGLLAGCGPKGAEPVTLMYQMAVGAGQDIVAREIKLLMEDQYPGLDIVINEGTNAEMYPKMVAQKDIDPNNPLINMGSLNAPTTAQGDLDDMWISLDPEKIPNMDDIYEAYRRPDNRGVAHSTMGVGFLYNTQLTEPPVSWLDLFDPKYKGKVAVFDYGFAFNGLLALASVLGSVDAAFEKYSQAARDGQFSFFYTSNAPAKDALVTGNVVLEVFFTSFGITWGKQEGGPIDYVVPAEGMQAMPVYHQIVKGSSEAQIDMASKFINTFISPEWDSRHCNLSAQIPTNKFSRLDANLALERAFQPDVVANAIQVDWGEFARKNAEWRERWDREVKAYM